MRAEYVEAMKHATGSEVHLTTAKRVAGWLRPAWVEVDLAAVEANVAYICGLVAPARVCAVVKADGYGHGAVRVAEAALAGGATHLGVALAEEGHELREAGIDAPVLVLSEPPPEAMRLVIEDSLTPTLYTEEGTRALVDAAATAVPTAPVRVHLKLDTGMHRVGASPEGIVGLARAIVEEPWLELEGLFTHLAVADEPADPFTAHQLDVLEEALAALGAAGIKPDLLHAANSAGTLWHPRSRYGMVRPGIALYGLSPSPRAGDTLVRGLRPALSFKAEVSYVKEVAAGEGLSYGLCHRLAQRSTVATVPVGYADGVPRRLSSTGGQVLIGGKRYPIAGSVTMDQLMVDCGPGAVVKTGDEVVLLGRQGDEEISAWDWALRLGTIAYEVTCALSPRLPRVYT